MPSSVETVKCAALSQNRLICPVSSFAENMFFFATALFSAEGLARERRTRILWGCKKNVQHGIFLCRTNRLCYLLLYLVYGQLRRSAIRPRLDSSRLDPSQRDSCSATRDSSQRDSSLHDSRLVATRLLATRLVATRGASSLRPVVEKNKAKK